MTFKEREQQYKEQQKVRIAKIKEEPNKVKRFFKWVWFLLTFPYIWVWINVQDWRTLIIFFISMAIVGCEVWIPALLGLITYGTDFSKWCLGFAATCELWWLSPVGSPFLLICISLTMGIKAVINKIKGRKQHE